MRRFLNKILERFRRDTRASTSTLFAVTLIGALPVGAFAIDYTRLVRARAELQNVADAAALSAARALVVNPSADFEKVANRFVTGNEDNDAGTKTLQLTVTHDVAKKMVTVQASQRVTNLLGMFLGAKTSDIGARAQSVYGAPMPIEISIVLDLSGSMNYSGKAAKAKQALSQFVTGLKDIPDLRVSFVPFTTVIKLDPYTFKNKPWLTWNASPLPATNSATWDGCVVDRPKPHNMDPFAAPSGSAQYPATTCSRTNWAASNWVGSANAVITPTDDIQAIKNRISGLNFDGYTNITLGAVWGGAMLAPDGPIAMAKPYGQAVKVMLLISDGMNTIDRWKPVPANSNAPHNTAMDPETKAACAFIKAKNIEVFTINVVNGDQALLTECATDTAHYFVAQDSGEIPKRLEEILEKIREHSIVRVAS